MALVIGNSNYLQEPLPNPVNDAQAMSRQLRGFGFDVSLLVDGSLQDMKSAVDLYSRRLAAHNAVGLFYYAGHAVQLDWRNYLLPVDAKISRRQDIAHQAIDLIELFDKLRQVQNGTHIIILDACRDNPFGKASLVDQKGLSQCDAPVGTLLSYATAPGNVASDGPGEHGLFTDHLLREMRTPGLRIEDLLKRVRLAVRKASQGAQIPWESTSLEDDFYFQETGKPRENNEQALQRLLQQETIDWQKVKQAEDLAALEAYLRQYPDGYFSQLAGVLLEKLLKKQVPARIATVPANGNPYTQGSASSLGKYRNGDVFAFVDKDALSGVIGKTYTEVVTGVFEDRIEFDGGRRVLDNMGNELKSPNPRFLSTAQFYPVEYQVGQKWRTRFGWKRMDGVASEMQVELRVIKRSQFSSEAGSFNAFQVEGRGYISGGGSSVFSYWIDPDRCPLPLVFEVVGRNPRNALVVTRRTELQAYRPVGA